MATIDDAHGYAIGNTDPTLRGRNLSLDADSWPEETPEGRMSRGNARPEDMTEASKNDD